MCSDLADGTICREKAVGKNVESEDSIIKLGTGVLNGYITLRLSK